MTLQQTQNEGGALWLEIQAAITAALTQGRGELAAITEDRDRVAKLLADARAAWDSGDLDRIRALAVDADKTEAQKKRDALAAEKARIEAELAALQ